ncbi:hypothetical protein ACIQMR_37695 [Streptomyces sp. NPDC091376]|uniref:hypothetical protein n=1 Tax=Streptomyces sp. NPDC091376 TaxID=3365994 RepID=UPI003819FB55
MVEAEITVRVQDTISACTLPMIDAANEEKYQKGAAEQILRVSEFEMEFGKAAKEGLMTQLEIPLGESMDESIRHWMESACV